MLSGLAPAFGSSLLSGGKTPSVNRWPYSFGDRYIYDNAGSRWNYNSAYKFREYRYRLSNRHAKYWHPRFEYNNQSLINDNFDGLIEHLSRSRFHHIRSFHPIIPYHYDPACR